MHIYLYRTALCQQRDPSITSSLQQKETVYSSDMVSVDNEWKCEFVNAIELSYSIFFLVNRIFECR